MTTLIELWYPSKDSLWKYFKTFFPLPIDRPYIKLSYKVPDRFAHTEGTVIDFESTGLPNDPKAKIITAGFFHDTLVEIYQCHNPMMIGKFQSIIRSLVLNRPFPLIGYSPEFECFFSRYGKPKKKIFYGEDYGYYHREVWEETIWKDVLQWGVGQNYYSGEYYNYRKKLVDCIDSPRTKEGSLIDYLGRVIPKIWAKWCTCFDQKLLFEIIYHNTLDLHRESYVANGLHKTIDKEREEIWNLDLNYDEKLKLLANMPKIITG